MTPQQEKHLLEIQKQFLFDVEIKYKKGVEEYKSNLRTDYSPIELLDNIMEEAVDTYVYAFTAKQRLEDENK